MFNTRQHVFNLLVKEWARKKNKHLNKLLWREDLEN